MNKTKIVDHLFRHQYGKMVAILTRIFGLSNLELVEDAVQDTFIKAVEQWKINMPENPEAWLTKAAKNRAIDLLRKIKADESRHLNVTTPIAAIAMNNLFLDNEIEDSQLRMIFTACHPVLNPKDQIAFALKTVAGFSLKEIAAALLLKDETVKKRLSRARKTIKDQSISFAIPDQKNAAERIDKVHEVLYLIFNEGFHSTKTSLLIQKELCGEAIRLISLILKRESLRTGEGYALFALFCLHSSRLETKLLDDGTLVDLKNQDRSIWHKPLINLGNNALQEAMKYKGLSSFHFEAAIAAEHTNAETFESTDWRRILKFHQLLHDKHPTDYSIMNQAIVLIQLDKPEEAKKLLDGIQPEALEKRAYLYYGILAEYYIKMEQKENAINALLTSFNKVTNLAEKKYIENKIALLSQ